MKFKAPFNASQTNKWRLNKKPGKEMNGAEIRKLPETRKLRYRKFKNGFFDGLCYFFTAVALLPLALILFYILREGAVRLDLNLFTETQPGPGNKAGGILNAIIGTLSIVTLATVIASPPAIMAGVYLAFHKDSKLSEAAYVANNILQSVPAIVFGIVVYSWVVLPTNGFSLFSGSVALALMMLPYITINTVEVIKMIPNTVIEAGYALGGSYPKVILKVVLPVVAPGIANAILLALGRVAGEAAPLLFTAFGNPYISAYLNEPSASLPALIFQFSIAPYESWQQLAWSASLVLIVLIITANLISKWLTRNSARF